MANYSAHNLGVLQRRMGSRLGSTGTAVAVEIFTEVAKSVFAFIDATGYYNDETFNLRDSVGVGIYDGGTLVKWIDNPTPKASGTTTYTYHGVKHTISGRDKLEKAINNAHRTTMGQYSMIIFCAAPYGYFVEKSLGDGGDNKRGKGWWSEGLIPEVRKSFTNECARHKIPINSYRYGHP
jgi:hypothetical protein